MAASINSHLTETHDVAITTTGSDGTALASVNLAHSIPSTAPLTLVAHGKDLLQLGASATNDINLWPVGVEALTSGDVLVMRCLFHYGSTDTTKNQKAITLKNGSTPDILYTWGHEVALSFDAVTAVLATRANNSNEVVRIERLWYIYTV